MLDWVLRGGRVIDGRGAPARVADVGIKDGAVVAVGDLRDATAATGLDATGRDVAPGFVDCHDHSDYPLVVDRRAASTLLQGVTTLVSGNCGFSAAPVPDKGLFRQAVVGYRDVYGVEPSWRTFGEYLETLRSGGTGVNVAPMVGHGAVRLAVMGFAPGPPSPEQLAAMVALVDEAMGSGAVGFSTGLEYQPGLHAELDEIVALAKVAARHGGVYASHIRGRAEQFVEAVDEAIAVGERAGLPVQISHMAPRPHTPPGVFETVLERIDQVARRGVQLVFDTMPYRTGASLLAELVPHSLTVGEPHEAASRMASPAAQGLAQQFFRERKHRYLRSGRPDDLRIVCAPNTPAAVGRTLGELADDADEDLATVVVSLLRAEGADFKTALFACHYARDEDLVTLVRQPRCALGSDGTATALDGALAGFQLERSAYGWAPRVLQEFVRERKVLSVEEAIRRMTSLPAQQFSAAGRGVLEPGAKADIVVFDRTTIADLTAPERPAAYPTGIEAVFVNGQLAVRNGALTGVLAGAAPA